MTETLVRDREELLDAEATPHLSYSRIQRYLFCPEQYRLYYVEKIRAKAESASLAFGAVMHVALAEYFRHKVEPLVTFQADWKAFEGFELRFSQRDSWSSLKEKGERLLEKFLGDEAHKFSNVVSVEKVFDLGLTNLNLPFVGIIDLIAEVKGKCTIVEFKTAAADFEEDEIALLDQLTAYQLAEPELEGIAVCVFLKSREPQIKWHLTRRSPAEVMDYLEKVGLVADQITQQNFYKRPGKWCRSCEFLPVCTGNTKKANETLVQII